MALDGMIDIGLAPARLRLFAVVKRSVVIRGHKTSVSLEDAFWAGLKEIAVRRGVALSTLIELIDTQRHTSNLSSAVRLFVLEYFQVRAMNAMIIGNGQRQHIPLAPD